MKRAYSLFEIKGFDDDKRILTGIATTPTPDRSDDIVEPKGAKFDLPLPFLWQHNSEQPIGHVTSAKVKPAGIEVSVKLAKVDEPGTLKDRLDEAWQSIKAGLVRGLSIGFQPLESAAIEGTFGRRFTSWDWLELSAVTIPANAEASIQTVKTIDTEQRAASGTTADGSSPGVSGKSKAVRAIKPNEGNTMNVQDQIKSFTDTRAVKAAAMEEIMSKAADKGETLDAEESEKYDELKDEVKTIDQHLERLREHEKTMAQKATPITSQANGSDTAKEAAKGASDARDGVIAVAKKLPPGVAFARYAGIMAAAKGSLSDAIQLAKDTFPEETQLHSIIKNHNRIQKAAVDVGTTLDSDYAAPLVQYNNMSQEFIEFLRPQTIIGQIQGLRRVPFNIRVPRQLTGGAASWVGEAKPKPVTSITLDSVTLKWKKLATIAVISQELARFSSPSAETMIRDALAAAIIQQMDSDFINPANAGVTDVKPASITNGVTPITTAGGTIENIKADIQGIFAPFIAANLTPVNAVWIMSATTALALSLMLNPLGQPAFPGISMTGGTFNGMQVVISEAVGNIVVLANASDILVADDGQVTIDSSSEASVQMDSVPTDPPAAGTVFISLWQMNLLGIRAERYIDWVKARPQSVQYIAGVEWGQPPSP